MPVRDVDFALVSALEKEALPLTGAINDYDSIVNAAAEKNFVLIGESSHGTREFYAIRAEITRRLIQEQGFDAVAVEADWPDAYAVNRYVSLSKEAGDARESLGSFERFPTWMWQNTEVLHFISWLRSWNAERRLESKNKTPVGFYGLDLYGMNTSIHAVIGYLEKTDAAAAKLARERYSCFDHFMDNPQAYGYAAETGMTATCEEEIVAQLTELRLRAPDYRTDDAAAAHEEYFCAEQNAKLVKNAEQYYRSMFSGRRSSWNIRDAHMFDTLKDLAAHIEKREGREAKIVVWAHNSHIGNAAATEMAQHGEINIGQLVREARSASTLLVGFSTSHGTVTAAEDWGGTAESVSVNLPFPGSYEEAFHHVNHKKFLIDLRRGNVATDLLMTPRLQRAIGVVYRPMTERQSHYFYACLPAQFDFLIHLDSTTAVQPLETFPHWHNGDVGDTFPYGL